MLYNKPLAENIGWKLQTRKLSIAVAESVTSGHLQAALSLAPDASKFFQGGITAYNIGQKCRHLLIDPTHALEFNSVSERIAADMATAVTTLFSSDYGIGITGYATLQHESGIHELFAYIAIVFHGELLIDDKICSREMDSLDVQVYYVNQVLQRLDKALT